MKFYCIAVLIGALAVEVANGQIRSVVPYCAPLCPDPSLPYVKDG
jgi:hypothetical protein